jgi:hypothetical protein
MLLTYEQYKSNYYYKNNGKTLHIMRYYIVIPNTTVKMIQFG